MEQFIETEGQIINKLIGMYLSRSKELKDNGEVVDNYTYTSEQRAKMLEKALSMLVDNMDAEKEDIARRLLNAEEMLSRDVTMTSPDGNPYTAKQTVIVNVLSAEKRKVLTDAIFTYNESKWQ